ncbi:hypothetical protein [Parasphingorhabdus sp.]|uniref:hypothetical protein n=1 Tax=Parasphingorhabdus sp. TaxID=2709688 RepID=UPI003C73FEC5
MESLQAKLANISRENLGKFLIGAIHELTIYNRFHYDEADGLSKIRLGNEAIHRLSGYLQVLANDEKLIDQLLLEGIAESSSPLTERSVNRILSHLV